MQQDSQILAEWIILKTKVTIRLVRGRELKSFQLRVIE